MATSLSNFAFTSGLTNFQCPTFFSGWTCPPPNACAHDAKTGRIYCCKQQDSSRCWTIPIQCANNASTLGCTNAGENWCCVNETETCITDTGRYNLCLSTAPDVLFDLSAEALNATYSSLASASPAASSYTFDPARLGAQTASSTLTTNTGTTVSTAQSTTTGQSTVTVVAGASTSLSGGAIGGIVVGAVIAVIIALGSMLFFLRRGRLQRGLPRPGAPPSEPVYIMPPAGHMLEAKGNLIYETGYTERAYEVEGPKQQVYEAGGIATDRHELPEH